MIKLHNTFGTIGAVSLLLTAGSGWAEVEFDGSLGAPGPLVGDMIIDAERGQVRGANLFHSFATFHVRAGESATFTGPTQIGRVISRVTGTEASVIDGLLRSTIDGADFYFMNPNGVMFGENSSLDLPASMYVSTADQLLFPDTVFEADVANVTLSVAAPEAFAFSGATQSPISFTDTLTKVPDGARLSVTAGDIVVDNANLYASSGAIDLVSVGAAGQVDLDSLDVSSSEMGTIEVRPLRDFRFDDGRPLANVDVSGDQTGAIRIRGGDLVMTSGFMFADTYGASSGGGIDVELAGNLALQGGARITAETVGDASGQGGSVALRVAGNVTLRGDFFGSPSRIATNAKANANAGAVNVNAGSVDMFDLAAITSGAAASGTGNAGNIFIVADDIRLENGARISATSASVGNAGTIEIYATSSFLATGFNQEELTRSGVSADAQAEGDAGDITIRTVSFRLENGAAVEAEVIADASGEPGTIQIVADNVVLDSGSLIDAQTTTSSNGGDIRIEAGEIEVRNTSVIRSFAEADSSGSGGSILIQGGELRVISGGSIDTGTVGFGPGGTLEIKLSNDGLLLVSGEGSAVRSNSGDLIPGLLGAGGRLEVEAGRVVVEDGATMSTVAFGTGAAGSLDVSAATDLLVRDASIETSSLASGGGNITVAAGNQILLDGGTLSASAQGTAAEDDGGNVTVARAEFLVMRESSIVARANAGDGGIIQLSADNFVRDTASVLDASSDLGNDGEVLVDSPVSDISASIASLVTEAYDEQRIDTGECFRVQSEDQSRFVVDSQHNVEASPSAYRSLLPESGEQLPCGGD